MIQRMTTWIGSWTSLLLHTCIFLGTFILGMFKILDWDTILLVLTTAVSLEAIYLAIFIQMTMNAQAASLKEVEEDIDEIQKDVDEIQGDVDEIQEDIDEIQEDVDEIQEDESEDQKQNREQQKVLSVMSGNLQQLLRDIDKMKQDLETSHKR